MNWLSWNVRGANKKYKKKELRKYIKTKHITLAGITEIKVREHKATTVAAVVAPNWGFLNNYRSAINGRIWLPWDSRLYIVAKLKEEAQLLHCQVNTIASNKTYVITVIYGYNTCEKRKSMWDTLKVLAQGMNMPWLIVGNFNAMLYPQDKLYGNPVQYGEIKDFNDCIHELILNEVRWTGDYYTQSNKQQSNERICSRLDRAFGNHEWMMEWGHIVMEYDVPLISDHNPMVLALQTNQSDIKVPFRFFNTWADHEKFQAVVKKVWKQKFSKWKMKDIWMKPKALKPLFKQLNNEEFRNITQRIDKERNELVMIQKQLTSKWSDDLMEQERTTMQNLEKWSMIEENIMKQKSRAKWIN
ncbi:PREDICTED: uncharacterized protein LOC109214833 [Nicotiana attenuata]|uniref:uncharacterized protein LOC109214833 n=1 Tax=Nicotiana attenuata TaxID=49451 RepID=UPI000904A450|nr:PREDICTED: uncharacterized protein LOC109214833 [Nicotiana attenuata]